MRRRFVFGALRIVAISGAVYLTIALGLILSQSLPKSLPAGNLDFSRLTGSGFGGDAELREITARDRAVLTAYVQEAGSEVPLVVLVHGSGWHGDQFGTLSRALAGQADIAAVNLRGHWQGSGQGPGTRGDISYLGQFEDDIADVISAVQKPGQKVVLAGHSSGGGLVVRFAGGDHGSMIDKAVLMAPFLKHNAPTTRPASGGWAHVLVRRIIGLSMLNTVGVHVLDHLEVIGFAMPQTVLDGPMGHTATLAYSWRLNTSFAPRGDYLMDVAALPEFLLIAGAEDESFVAQAYAPLMSAVTNNGRFHVLDGVGHLAIVNDPRTAALIGAFLEP